MESQYPSVLAKKQSVGQNSGVMNGKYKTPLDRFMSEQGVKDTELAAHTGIPQPTITRYRNKLRPHAHEDKLQPLADWLGVTVAELQGKELGDQLPPEAIKIARIWLSLAPTDRKTFRTIIESFKASDSSKDSDSPPAPPPRPHR